MLNRIDIIIREIEAINQEIDILLGLAKINMVDYVLYKRGDKPEVAEIAGSWSLHQLDEEVSKLNISIQKLEKLRREMLNW